ncbi:MAG: hypothetical protein PHO55_06620 [Thiomonas arsenitoxydans]|jgi:hypothetical protein|nr:hypothetical protein [Thiomonas arsenitoxydans]
MNEKPYVDPDDRIRCQDCANCLSMDRPCKAAAAKLLQGVSPYAQPMPGDFSWRCEGFAPKKDAADQRSGKARWPWLPLKVKIAAPEEKPEEKKTKKPRKKP